MLACPTAATRIRTLRPLRPPPHCRRTVPSARRFTQNGARRLLIAHHAPRPQLPYLAQPAFKRPAPLNGPSQQLARLLSTENSRFVREQFWLATKWTLIIWTFLVLGGVSWYGISIEMDERTSPTPAEWTFFTRQYLRAARAFKDASVADRVGFVDWAKVGSSLMKALARLEDEAVDGKGLAGRLEEDEAVLIPGVGRAGCDISGKSWAWRSGYFEVIMGSATAAEHLDGMVLDKTRGLVFPKEVVVGPSNPDPRPVPPYMASAPREEDCVPPFPPPETFYMRILTGKGFTTKQKLEAAGGYGNWLEYKRLVDSAEEMYLWAVDIAKAALPPSVNAEDVVDSQTAVLKQGDASREATPNLLRATTDLAIHRARNGNVAAALPIFLSVLRARRTAPLAPFPQPTESEESSEGSSLMSKIFLTPQFPPPPPSGDSPLIRASEQPTCEDSELMLYIGEILFATSPSSDEGLGWTRQAVTIADVNLAQSNPPPGVDAAAEKKKCKECLLTGVGNWETMLRRVAAKESSLPAKAKSWLSWAGGGEGEEAKDRSDLENEMKRVEALKDRIVREGIDALGKSASNPSGVWIG